MALKASLINILENGLVSYLSMPRVLAIIFASFSLYGLVTAASFGSANIDYYFVKNTLTLWQQGGVQYNEIEYNKAKAAILAANYKQPSHPLYLDLIGQIYEWGYVKKYDTNKETLLLAKSYYLKASKARPSWPVTWASLAMVKWHLQEFDDEMLQYVSLADSLGPKKAEVDVLFAELGLALYINNHPMYLDIRQQVKNRISQGLLNHQSRQRIIFAIKKYKAERIVCLWLENESAYITQKLLSCNIK